MDANGPDAKAWSDLVKRFLTWLQEEERSAHTIRNYGDDLAVFTGWYRARFGEEPDIDRLTKRDLLDWKDAIEKEGGRKDADGNPRAAKLATVNRKLAAVRKFFAWARSMATGSGSIRPSRVPARQAQAQVPRTGRTAGADPRGREQEQHAGHPADPHRAGSRLARRRAGRAALVGRESQRTQGDLDRPPGQGEQAARG